MKETLVKRDGQKDLKFTGTELASVSSKTNSGLRWTELRLFKTGSGKYVIDSRGITRNEGEVDRFEGHVCESAEAVVAKLTEINKGYLGSLAKELLDSAGIGYAEEIT